MAGAEDGTGIYPYKPNSKVCIVAAILFGGSAFFHVWQMLRKRTWFYTPFVVGSISEFFRFSSIIFNVTDSSSDDSWLYRQILFRKVARQYDAVHSTISLHHSPALPLRCHYLHDLWPNRRLCQHPRCIYNPAHSSHKDLCYWRCGCLPDASRRWWHDGSSQYGKHRAESHAVRPLCPASILWFLLICCFDILQAHALFASPFHDSYVQQTYLGSNDQTPLRCGGHHHLTMCFQNH